MKVTLCWYGGGHDPIPPKHIRRTPEISGVMDTLPYRAVGVSWEEPEIENLVGGVHAARPEYEVTESVDIHRNIKLGLPTRDKYIDAYNRTLENLARYDVEAVMYNFMPAFDRLHTDLAYETEDSSDRLCYNHKKVEDMSPRDVVELTTGESSGLTLPGWKPERLADLDRVMGFYQGVDHGTMHANYRYFLKGITSAAGRVGIETACHPDDPARGLFGLPRIRRNHDDMDKTARLYDSDNHGFCTCTGSSGSNTDNDIPAVIREFGGRGRLYAAHVHSVKYIEPKFFHESPHPSSCGDLDIYTIMGAIYETSPSIYIRLDHRRMVQGETGYPSYSLYDRALDAVYLASLREVIEKTHKRE